MLSRPIAYRLLQEAITLHRQARISLAAIPFSADREVRLIAMSRLKGCRSREAKARRDWAPYAREDRIQRNLEAIKAKRYWRQIQSRSRTTEPARVQRAEREQRRQQAHQAATAKRMANRAQS